MKLILGLPRREDHRTSLDRVLGAIFHKLICQSEEAIGFGRSARLNLNVPSSSFFCRKFTYRVESQLEKATQRALCSASVP